MNEMLYTYKLPMEERNYKSVGWRKQLLVFSFFWKFNRMPTVSERERQQQQDNGKKAKAKKKSMAKENEKVFLPRKELPFPFEKELFQKQVKNTPAVIMEFIPINDSDNRKVIVFYEKVDHLLVGLVWLLVFCTLASVFSASE